MGVFAEWRNDYCGNYMYINDSYGSCKAVYLGSIPGRASSVPPLRDRSKARMVKLVDTRDLKSLGASHTGSSPVPGTSKQQGITR